MSSISWGFAKVEELFKDASDLSSAFRDFLPGAGGAADTDCLGVPRHSGARTSTPSGEHASLRNGSSRRSLLQSPRLPLPGEDGELWTEIKRRNRMLSVPREVE